MTRGRKDSPEDWQRYKKLEQENDKLKREVSKLRKLLNNSVIDQLEGKVSRIEEGGPAIEPICDKCGKIDFHKVPLKRADGNFEIRICLICGHRSAMRKIKQKVSNEKQRDNKE
jgi:hypothetical protein